jgi:hypothetical protein
MENVVNQAYGAVFNPGLVPLPGYPIPMELSIEPFTSARGWVNMHVNAHVVTVNGRPVGTAVIHYLVNPQTKQLANFKFKSPAHLVCGGRA